MSTEITIIYILGALLLGIAIGLGIARLLTTATTDASVQAVDQRLTDRDTQITDLKSSLETERRTATNERHTLSTTIEALQRELREAVEARAKLEGVGQSLEALKSQLEAKAKEIDRHVERITSLSSDISRYKTESEEATKAKNDAIAVKGAEVERLLKEKDRHIDEQRRLLAEAEKKLAETFDSLSVKALTTVSEQFLKTARATLEAAQAEAKGDLQLKQQAIDELLKPVAETLSRLEGQHKEMEERRVSAFDSIEKGIRTLSAEADQLANALRKPSTRGAWGEMNLKVILDNAGLEEGQHYDLQDSTDDEDGARLRTDVIIHLPNGRDFIIDSKSPLDSYWDGMNAQDEATRLVKFAAHSRLVRDHVKRLSSKGYWTRYKASPDCVVMFIPTEGAYQAVIGIAAYVLANPMTLVSMIHIAAYVLKEERSRQNASEIQASASELYKRVSKFVGDFAAVGRNLRLSVQSYNTAVGSLDGRVLPKAREISRLGAGSGAELDDVVNIEISPRELTSQEARELPVSAEPAEGLEGGN